MLPDLSLAGPDSSHNVTINPERARRPASSRAFAETRAEGLAASRGELARQPGQGAAECPAGAARPRGCRRGNAGGMASDGTSPTGNRRPRRAFVVTFLLSALYSPVRGLLCALGSVDDHNIARHGGGLHAGQASIRVKVSSAEGAEGRSPRRHDGCAGQAPRSDPGILP
jgi:hypothetical protein